METPFDRAIAIVGISCVLPDAPDAGTFWKNVTAGRYSISEVDPARWDPTLYYDPDPSAPDKTYSTIGGWVREAPWDPLGWKLPIPPRVNDAMDEAQRWAVSCTRAALLDWGWPAKQYDPDRTAVILGNAMAGEKHYQTALRIALPEYVRALEATPSWSGLPSAAREALQRELAAQVDRTLPRVTEDTMPGELANCMAGRVANLFNFHGPNFVTDAACASAMAAISAAIAGLLDRDFDLVVTGGIDRNMGAATSVKFCKIGALSATGTRPYGDGADGFVMGEGAALFLLKRLADAERDGDRIYAVIRGIGGSSDGKGKGITAPNPAGQLIAIRHAWQDAGVRPDRGTMIEGHGTSTRVGDVVEVESLASAFAGTDLPPGTIPLGSVKSNIGHLKGAAGAAGLLKAALALHEKVLPPSLNAERPNPNIDFAKLPFAVNHTLRPWEVPAGTVRRAGVSAFGFGGTNFHVVLEEHIPGRLASEGNGRRRVAVPSARPASAPAVASVRAVPPRGALVVGGPSVEALRARLQAVQSEAAAGRAPAPAAPEPEALRAPERVAIDYGDARELADKCAKALKALAADTPPAWKALRAQGIFRGRGTRPKVAFLYTGQGSQYVNMLAGLRASEPIVAETFAEADRVMTPLLGRPLTSYLFVDPADPALVAQAEEDLRQTAITQPAVLAVDIALTRLLAAHGIQPDCVMGHSLGEYGALVAADALPFADALEAVSARGREMTNLAVEDNGAMAAILAPIEEIEKIVAGVQGYVVIANVNSRSQAVIGGATAAVQAAIAACQAAGFTAIPLPVSHAFHTRIVAPASEPLRRTLQRLRLAPPRIPVIANVSGDWYPTGPDAVARMLDILAEQVASPVQFVRGLETLHRAGVRVFVEVGPKKALAGFVEDVLGSDPEVVSLFTNHPKLPDAVAFNQALCGLFAAGFGASSAQAQPAEEGSTEAAATPALTRPASATLAGVAPHRVASTVPPPSTRDGDTYTELGRLFAGVLERGWQLLGRGEALAPGEPVVISGAGLGLPGPGRIFGDDTVGRLLRGEQMIDVIPMRFRRAMLDKHITRLVKSDEGGPVFQTIDDLEEVIKLAGRGGEFDLAREYGIPAERIAAYDVVTRLAIAAGFEALRDAGIPLVMRYRTTSTGGRLPEGWRLPADMADDTGIVFASVFPGYDAFADEMERYHRDRARREHLADLEALRARLDGAAYGTAVAELDRRIHDLRAEIARDPYQFDRRFLFRILAMGHSQFAELVGARGPNTQINAACASTTQAISVAEDWIRTGRCRRVIVLSADDASGEHLLEWIGAGFLASGAAATDDVVEKAALPFDRRRHGMLIGMGAAAFVLESAAAARERGIAPLCEVLAATSANSAFHGTRLDVEHICQVMERLVREAEARGGIDRRTFASQTVFVSHETYTPARGGSAAAEVEALRKVFGADAQRIVVANTKGYTGHPMGVGIEDVLAVKALETGLVPAVPNFREPDPELGVLNLSKGGMYPVEYALRLGAGFGSQIAMTLLRRVPPPGGVRPALEALGYQYRIADVTAWEGWLARAAGRSGVTLEVVDRKLRIRDEAVSQREAQPPAVAPVRPQPAPTPPSTLASPARGADAAAPAASPPPPSVVSARPAAPPSPAAAAGTPTGDPLAERVLALVAEKTGYPRDMLDLDLDLEADLGIDTVKQAEMFATIREAWDIPRDPKLKLRDFPTLRHVIQFVRDRRPDLAALQAPAPAATPTPATALTAVAATFPRRVVVPVLRPPLEVCKETGARLDPGNRVLLVPDRGGIGDALAAELRGRGVEPLVAGVGDDTDALLSAVNGWLETGPIHGVYWLPALDPEPSLMAMDLATWRLELDARVKRLHAVMQRLYDQEIFLVSATRLGGFHGYDEAGAWNPMGGAVTGFTKAFKREQGGRVVKAVDFPPDWAPADIARTLVEETLRDPGAVEIGRHRDERWSPGLVEQPLGTDGTGLPLGPETVMVVTGGAGSIVAAIVADLAAACRGGHFHLLDRVAAPAENDPDVARIRSDREGLKRELFERLKARGERATPAMIERELAAIERSAAAATALEAVRAAGGQAHWHAVDLLDGDAVQRAVGEVCARHGRIDVLVHAAGLEISRALPDKTAAEFARVLDVKCDGWFSLLRAIGDTPLGATVVFSSIAGRFGNAGQTDYAAANDLLCKWTSHLRRLRPGTRALAIDWTAWAEIGMASRGSIPTIMAAAGIDMLPPSVGIPVVRNELGAGTAGEVVVAGRLGILQQPFDATGGVDPERLQQRAPGPMIGQVVAASLDEGLVVETTLDPRALPFLDHHRIDGIPVLPGVMGMEAFAEVARLAAPGWHPVAVESVDFLAPVKFHRDQPRTLRLAARVRPGTDGLTAECTLSSSRLLPGRDLPEVTVNFRGRVQLGSAPPPALRADVPPIDSAAPHVEAAAIYRIYFHGPAYQVLRSVHRVDGGAVGIMASDLPPDLPTGAASPLTRPREAELCFQAAGILELARTGALGLPQHVGTLEITDAGPPSGRVLAVVAPAATGRGVDVRVMDESGTVRLVMREYRTIALPASVDEAERAPMLGLAS